MRTAFSIAALAAGALAIPYKRDAVSTDWDVVYVTDVVTVTAGQAPAPAAYTSASSSSSSSEAAAAAIHYGHHNGWHTYSSVWTSAWATTWTEVASEPTTTTTSTTSTSTTSTSSTPVYTPPPSSTPEPETTTSTTPVYQAPVTTSAPAPTSTYVAPSSSAAPTTSASAGSYGSADPVYGKSVIDSHNLHRSNHSASDLVWDDDLYNIAIEIGQTCTYAHNTEMGGGGYGQNIAAGVDAASIMNVITDMFYNGEEWQFAKAGLYGQANPDMTDFEDWGHFTQIVWKSTTSVACYTTTSSDCPNGLKDSNGNDLGSSIPPYFTVCNYKGPGNYAGEYADNVGSPLGQPVVWAASESV